jgi:hypothetical protein
VPLLEEEAVARLFTCGFEENDLTATMWNAIVGSPSIVASPVHSGSRALEIVNAGGAQRVERHFASALIGTGFYRFYLRIPSAPDTNLRIFTMLDSPENSQMSVLLTTSRTLLLQNDIIPAHTTGAAVLAVDTWYRIEIRHLYHASAGELELRLYLEDETTPLETLSRSGENTGTNTARLWLRTQGATVTLYFDDVAVNDSSGSFQNSWCGPGKMALLKPDADVSVAWTKSGSSPAGTNFGGVNEVPGAPDDGVAYNSDSGTTNVDRLGLTDLPAEVPADAQLILFDAYARVRGGAASQQMILRVWDEGGNATDGPAIALPNGSWAILSTAQHLVKDLAGKTKAHLVDWNAGYKGSVGASAKDVTALWANIEWIEGAAPQLVWNRVVQNPLQWRT